jgi:hypothetical protein
LEHSLFPWRLAQAGEPELCHDVRLKVCQDLCHCEPACLERGVVGQVRALYDDPVELLNAAHVHKSLRTIFREAPVDNIANEDRFARQECYARAERGNASSSYTVAARHTLPEAMAMHRLAMNSLKKECSAQRAPEPKPKRPRNGFGLFVNERGGNIISGSPAWNRLSAAEREAFCKRAHDRIDDIGDAGNAIPRQELTDEFVRRRVSGGFATVAYPMTPQLANEAQEHLNATVKEWERLVGKLFGDVGSDLDAPVHYGCDFLFGSGRCKRDFTANEHDRIKTWKRVLVANARAPHVKIENIDLPVVVLIKKGAAAAGSDDHAAGNPEETVDGPL